MTREEQAALIAWLRRPGVAWSTVTDLLEERGEVSAALAGAGAIQTTLFDVGRRTTWRPLGPTSRDGNARASDW